MPEPDLSTLSRVPTAGATPPVAPPPTPPPDQTAQIPEDDLSNLTREPDVSGLTRAPKSEEQLRDDASHFLGLVQEGRLNLGDNLPQAGQNFNETWNQVKHYWGTPTSYESMLDAERQLVGPKEGRHRDWLDRQWEDVISQLPQIAGQKMHDLYDWTINQEYEKAKAGGWTPYLEQKYQEAKQALTAPAAQPGERFQPGAPLVTGAAKFIGGTAANAMAAFNNMVETPPGMWGRPDSPEEWKKYEENQAENNATADWFNDRIGRASYAAAKSTGQDPDSLWYKTWEQIPAFTVPVPIEFAKSERVAAAVSRMAQKGIPVAKVAAAYSPELIASGSLVHTAATALGVPTSLLGWGERLAGGTTVFKTSTSMTDTLIKKLTGLDRPTLAKNMLYMLQAPGGVRSGEWMLEQTSKEIDGLKAEAQHMMSKLDDNDLADIAMKGPDGNPLYSANDLKGDAKAVKLKLEKIDDLTDKLDEINNQLNYHNHRNEVASFMGNMIGNTTTAALVGGAFGAVNAPTGQAGQGFFEGAVNTAAIGAAFSPFASVAGMHDLRLKYGKRMLIQMGSRGFDMSSLAGVHPYWADQVLMANGYAHSMDGRIRVIDPATQPNVIPTSPMMTPEGVRQMPANGFISTDGKTLYLNKNALGQGTAYHELSHLLQRYTGQMLRMHAPDIMLPFEEAYAEASGDPKFSIHEDPETVQKEMDAEIGRIVMQHTPIETFFGGEHLGDVMSRKLKSGDMFGKIGRAVVNYLNPDKIKYDEKLNAPYTREQVDQMRQALFEMGKRAQARQYLGPPIEYPEGRGPWPPEREEPTPAGPPVTGGKPEVPSPEVPEAPQHPDYQAEYDKGAAAEQARQANPNTKKAQAAIDRAGIEAAAKAHRAVVGDDSDLVSWYEPTKTIAGMRGDFENDPFHQMLVQHAQENPDFQSNPKAIENLNNLEAALQGGRAVTVDYSHAPGRIGGTRQEREAARRAAEAPARVAGEAALEKYSKSFVPTRIEYSPNQQAFIVRGLGTDKLLQNASKVIDWVKTHKPEGESGPMGTFQSVNDPLFLTYVQWMNENYRNGYRANGNPIKGTAEYPVDVNTKYNPHVIPKDYADQLNVMMGNVGARATGERPTKAQLAKQELSKANVPYYRGPSGEPNKLRDQMPEEFWKGLHPAATESVRPELADNVREESAREEEVRHKSGFTGDRRAFATQGVAPSEFTAANLMPPTGYYTKTGEVLDQKMQKSADTEQIKALLRNNGVSPHEMRWLGFDDLPKGKMTKDEIQQWVAAHTPEVAMTRLGGAENIGKPLQDWMAANRWGRPADHYGWQSLSDHLEQLAKIAQERPAEAGVGPHGDYDSLMALAMEADRIGNEETQRGRTIYHMYTKPLDKGGTNYRELLYNLPTKPPPVDQERINQLTQNRDAAQKLVEDERPNNWNLYTQMRQAQYAMRELKLRASEYGPLFEQEDFRKSEEAQKKYDDLNQAYLDSSAKIERGAEEVRSMQAELNKLEEQAKPPILYTSPHFEQHGKNLFAHMRVDDRTTASGHKMLFSQEYQSDWGQEVIKKGLEKLADLAWEQTDPDTWQASEFRPEGFPYGTHTFKTLEEAQAKAREVAAEGVKDFPFTGERWKKYLLREQIKQAIAQGKDSIGWTTGEQQRKRYQEALFRAVRSIDWQPSSTRPESTFGEVLKIHRMTNGDYKLYPHGVDKEITKPEGGRDIVVHPEEYSRIRMFVNPDGIITEASEDRFKNKKVVDVFGKDIANQIMSEERGEVQPKDFHIGGEGKENLYDLQFVKLANEIGKKFGAKVQDAQIQTTPATQMIQMKSKLSPTAEWEDYGQVAHGSTEEYIKAMMARYAADYPNRDWRIVESAPAKTETVHELPITPDMVKSVQEKGFPLFMPHTADESPLPEKKGFYTKSSKIITAKMPQQATREQLVSLLKNNGVGKNELFWLGFTDEKGNPSPDLPERMTKDGAQEWITANVPDITMTQLGGAGYQPSDAVNAYMQRQGLTVPTTPSGWRGYADAWQTMSQNYAQNDPATAKYYADLSKDADELAKQPAKPRVMYSGYAEPGAKNYKEFTFQLGAKPDMAVETKRRSLGDALNTATISLAELRRQFYESSKAIKDFDKSGRPLKDLPEMRQENRELEGKVERAANMAQELGMMLHQFNVANPPKDAGAKLYRSSHFEQYGQNMFAHMRTTDRNTLSGNNTLFSEEYQSDWGKEALPRPVGRGVQMKVDPMSLEVKDHPEFWTFTDPRNKGVTTYPDEFEVWKTHNYYSPYTSDINEARQMAANYFSQQGVKDFPFKSEAWKKYLLRQQLRMAVDQGKDSISWTSGYQQARRNFKLNEVNKITVNPIGPDDKGVMKYNVEANRPGDYYSFHAGKGVNLKWIQKYMPEKVSAEITKAPESREPTNFNFDKPVEIGGEGKKSMYDEQIVQAANDIGKPFGVKVTPAQIQFKEGTGRYTLKEERYGTDPAGTPFYVVNDVNGNPVWTAHSREHAQRWIDEHTKAPVIEPVHEMVISPDMRKSIQEHGQSLWMPHTEGENDNLVSTLDGKPIRLYHGAGQANLPISEMQPPIYFSPDKEVARGYSEQSGVFQEPLAAHLNLQNPLQIQITPQEFESRSYELGSVGSSYIGPERMAALQRQGYDGVVSRFPDGSIFEALAFDPKQIRQDLGRWSEAEVSAVLEQQFRQHADINKGPYDAARHKADYDMLVEQSGWTPNEISELSNKEFDEAMAKLHPELYPEGPRPREDLMPATGAGELKWRERHFDATPDQLEQFLIFSRMVANKRSSERAPKVEGLVRDLLEQYGGTSPFEALTKAAEAGKGDIEQLVYKYGLAPYKDTIPFLYDLAQNPPDLKNASAEDLQNLFGIGHATANFFKMHTDPTQSDKVKLDTHVLRWLRNYGGYPDAPVATPPKGPIYDKYADAVREIAAEHGTTPSNLDLAIWLRDSGNLPKEDYAALAQTGYRLGEKGPQLMPATDPWEEIARYLTPEQLDRVAPRFRDRIIAPYLELDSDLGRSLLYASRGAVGRKWYDGFVNSIQEIFHSDHPEFAGDPERFAAVMASLSANRSVPEDVEHSLMAWALWEAQNRPKDRASIDDIIHATVPTDSEDPKASLPAWLNNAFRAFTSEDPAAIRLSGPKVHAFYQNLIGDVHAVTVDRHMGIFGYGNPQVGARRVQMGEQQIGIESFKNLAFQAHIRKVADVMSEISGETWTPAEAQAAIWTYQIPVQDLADKLGITTEEFLMGGGEVPQELMETTPTAKLFQSEQSQATIRRLQRLRERNIGSSRAAGAEGAGGEGGSFPEEAGFNKPRGSGAGEEPFRAGGVVGLAKKGLIHNGYPSNQHSGRQSPAEIQPLKGIK